MKKLLSLVGVGFLGLSALQGCAASVSSDEADSVAKTEDAVNACYTNSGLLPTKAALAVAMATELGRWEPAKDLVAVTGLAAFPMNTERRNSARRLQWLVYKGTVHLGGWFR